MAQLILVPTAQTDWKAQGRLAGDTDLPLNEQGHRQAVAFGEAIASFQPSAVHGGPEKATKQTATIIANELRLKAKTVKDLREMDLGHWEGLTKEEFRERFSKVYKQWRSSPASIEPPEGEAVAEVATRLQRGVRKILKRAEGGAIVLALGQFAFAILRCEIEDGDFNQFWDYVDGEAHWHVMDMPANGLPEAGDKKASEESSE
jgi:broad specificity phosphatase PhoE